MWLKTTTTMTSYQGETQTKLEDGLEQEEEKERAENLVK